MQRFSMIARASDHRNVDGIVVPTKRRVYAADANKAEDPGTDAGGHRHSPDISLSALIGARARDA